MNLSDKEVVLLTYWEVVSLVACQFMRMEGITPSGGGNTVVGITLYSKRQDVERATSAILKALDDLEARSEYYRMNYESPLGPPHFPGWNELMQTHVKEARAFLRQSKC
jgi:hypothetical protein